MQMATAYERLHAVAVGVPAITTEAATMPHIPLPSPPFVCLHTVLRPNCSAKQEYLQARTLNDM